jgi:nicotinamide-nucleotide amidase
MEEDKKNLWNEIIRELSEKNLTISTMESCTGGGIANEITNISGASMVFKEAYITYSNEAKIKRGVSQEVIEKYTVYSPEVAKEMAKVVKQKTGSDYSIGITGQLGRIDPNNPVNKLNIVWYAILNNKNDYIMQEVHVADVKRNQQKKIVLEDIAKKLLSCLENK